MKNKLSLFWTIIAISAVLALIEYFTVGLPFEFFTGLHGIALGILCLVVVPLVQKFVLYRKTKTIRWGVLGSVALLLFVAVSGGLLRFVPIIINTCDLGGLASMVLAFFGSIFITAVLCYSLYLYFFRFCESHPH